MLRKFRHCILWGFVVPLVVMFAAAGYAHLGASAAAADTQAVLDAALAGEVDAIELASRVQAGQEAVVRANNIVLAAFGIGAVASIVLSLTLFSRTGKTIEGAAGAVSESSVEITATIEQHERTASRQSSAVNETTATLAGLTTSSRQSAEQTEAVSQRTLQALSLSDEGGKTVRETLEGMSQLEAKVHDIANQTLLLSEKTGQIGSIMKLVSDMANQTNILALNAAVEAARAGENGKGFAVVADEIRKLAEESKKSAQKIHELVEDIQTATDATVAATAAGTETVNAGIEKVRRAGEAFQSMASSMNSASESVQQISLNVKQQAVAINQVTETMLSINEGVKETAAGIAQTKAAVAHLNSAAISLKETVV